MTAADARPDLDALKQGQRAMWGVGDYADVAVRILPVSERLCERIDVRGGERVLDVACGTGNTSIAAARRFADVTGIDYSDVLLARARDRAAAEGLDVELRLGDAESLPVDDAAFDVVLSTCGAMFAPDQERAAEELLRACRPGGRIGMVNWTPDSWVGDVGRIVARHLPPPAAIPPPVAWGDPDHVDSLLGHGADVRCERRTFRFAFRSVEHHVRYLCEAYPPIVAALARLEPSEREALRADLSALAADRGDQGGSGLVLDLEYLEVAATRR